MWMSRAVREFEFWPDGVPEYMKANRRTIKVTREEAYTRLNEVFRDVLDDDTIELYDHTVADDVDGWDSFEHINLVVAVEEEFSFKIPMGKVVTMKNVGEMVDIILESGK